MHKYGASELAFLPEDNRGCIGKISAGETLTPIRIVLIL
jgi:hypothetical protein